MDGIGIELDPKDAKILAHLEKNGNEDIEDLADRLDLSKSTVYYRVNSLKERGIITGITADIDPYTLGLNILIITDVFVSHEPGYAEDIGTKLAKVSGVQSVYYTMGDVDFKVISRAGNRSQMNEIIDNIVRIDGVNETSSTFVMDEIKRGEEITAAFSDDP